MIGAIQSDESQVFNGARDVLKAFPVESVLSFEHDGEFKHGKPQSHRRGGMTVAYFATVTQRKL